MEAMAQVEGTAVGQVDIIVVASLDITAVEKASPVLVLVYAVCLLTRVQSAQVELSLTIIHQLQLTTKILYARKVLGWCYMAVMGIVHMSLEAAVRISL